MTSARPTRRLHLVRHGEVENPERVVYGRLSDFHLSERGARMAEAAAGELVSSGRPVDAVISSPLERTIESAQPIADAFDLPIELNPLIVEASSKLEGGRYDVSLSLLARPSAWRHLINPLRPSWGEPYAEVISRMDEAMSAALDRPGTGDVVLVSHQLPIWMAARRAAGRGPVHDPRKRRCALSSITSFEWNGTGWNEVAYRDPAVTIRARSGSGAA